MHYSEYCSAALKRGAVGGSDVLVGYCMHCYCSSSILHVCTPHAVGARRPLASTFLVVLRVAHGCSAVFSAPNTYDCTVAAQGTQLAAAALLDQVICSPRHVGATCLGWH
eukprot:scaffold183649_cov44-Tisochrysis_lutea.AAC.3